MRKLRNRVRNGNVSLGRMCSKAELPARLDTTMSTAARKHMN